MISRILGTAALAVCLSTTACADPEAPTQPNNAGVPAVKLDAKTMFPGLPDTNHKDWRDLDPENTLIITTKYGEFIIELAPEFAPNHVAQIKKLARQGFYDNLTFHRVMDGFMNQTGDPLGNGTGDSSLPDITAEFAFRRGTDMNVTLVGEEQSEMGIVKTGFYKAFPVATKPIGQAMLTKDGKVDAFGLHCPGTTSMARGGDDVNSGNSQFFLMRNEYPSLNTLYSIWGRTVWGNEHLTKIKVGTFGETPGFVPDRMQKVQVAADVKDRPQVQVMRTDTQAFNTYLEALKIQNNSNVSACDIKVPARLK